MHSISVPGQADARAPRLHSRRLLALVGDERLVEQIRRGNEAAFEVAYGRYGTPILAFCRHMLGSREEAEDAVQHTFAAAYRQLLQDDRAIALKPWLYTIARHRCVSILRARREHAELGEVAIAGLSEQVERRAELRALLADVAELPPDQRAALLLAETADLSHAEIATVLGCEVQQVKALVYRARSSLIVSRDARELPCEQVRERLATLRGGSLRRGEIVHHLKACAGCREYRAKIKRQRALLATALPVTPTAGLKLGVLGAIGGGGAAGGGGAVVGGFAAGLGGTAAVKALAVAGAAAVGAIGVGAAVAPPAGDPVRSPAARAPSPAGAHVTSTRGMDVSERRGPVAGTRDRLGDAGRSPEASARVQPGRSSDRDARHGAPGHLDRIPPGHIGRIPPGQEAGRIPPGHAGRIPPGHVGRISPGRDAGRVPPGREAGRVPPGRDAARLPPGRDSARVPTGRDGSRVVPGRDPAGVPPGRHRAGGAPEQTGTGSSGRGPVPIPPGRALSGQAEGGTPSAPNAVNPGAGRTTAPDRGAAVPAGDGPARPEPPADVP